MFHVEFKSPDSDFGQALVPRVPVVGEHIFLWIDGNTTAYFRVVEVTSVYAIKRDVDCDFDRNQNGVVRWEYETTEVDLEIVRTDDPEFSYRQ